MLRDESVGSEATWCGGEDGEGTRCAELHRTLKRIVKARGALDAQEAEALRAAERQRLWRSYGYGSLLEYMEMELGYSPRAALERLRVANAIVELPAIADALTQGELSFSAARELTRVATAETEGQWLESSADKNLRQIEELVSGHKRGDKPTDPADPVRRKRRLRFDDLDPETIALVRQVRQILDHQCGERLDDNAFVRALARSVIDGAASTERTRAPYQIAVTTCGECNRVHQDGGGITVEMSAAAAEVAHCDAEHIGRVDRAPSSANAVTSTPATTANVRGRATSDIPPATRRKVKARDDARCRVPWCRSSRNIDQHHVVPRSQGGTHALENLITLCESHHIALHEGALLLEGNALTATFARRAQTAFANAQHAVDAATALRTLGFDKHIVATAIERTRTHVGSDAAPLEQWIKIALSYCPKPTA